MTPPYPPPQATTNIVHCACGHAIGPLITVKGIMMLDTGTALARVYHGICKGCYKPFHWLLPDESLALLIQHTLAVGDGRIEGT